MKELEKDFEIEKAYIDSTDPNPQLYKKRLNAFLGHSISIVCENKADVKYPIVSAASIIAKEARENEMEALGKLFEQKCSGYPSDPNTMKAIYNLDNLPKECKSLIRSEWRTIKRNSKDKHQKKLDLFF